LAHCPLNKGQRFRCSTQQARMLLAAAINSTVVAVENLTVGSAISCRLRA